MDFDRALDLGLGLIRQFEGLILHPYLCSAGVPTIGYGSTYYQDGSRVSLADTPIDKATAEYLLKLTVRKTYFPAVVSLCPTLETEEQTAAILSWTYNLGVGALKSSNLRRKILLRDWDNIPTEILKWNRAAGKENKGLTRRRQAEAKIFTAKK